jgi:glycosyltransferase involved in cell wall biosynthesis
VSLSVIIPVFNEEQSIKNTLMVIHEMLMTTSSLYTFEILVIDDGSSDKTAQEITSSGIPCQVIRHKFNRGYGASLKTGLRHATCDDIVIIDADGTYPHDRIPEMYAYYREQKLDMLVGSRTGDNVAYPFLKRIPKFFLTKLANYISNTRIPDLNSGLRIFNKEIALQFFNLYPNGFSFTTTITVAMLCKGYEVDFFPINYFPRQGRSKISPIKDTLGFFQLLSAMAVFFNPLKVFMPFVCVLALISSVFIVRDVFIQVNLSQSVVLFPILTILIFFMGLMADMISKK